MSETNTPSREEICDFYFDVSKKMDKNLFCCLPVPHFVKEDERLAPIYEKYGRKGLTTCDAQIEYHRKMQEDPENAKAHYVEYAAKMGLNIDEPVDLFKNDAIEQ